MPQPLSLVARAAGWSLGLYALLWLIASLWTMGREPTIDTRRALSDIYVSDVREFVYRLPAFCEDARHQRNLLIVGGSTANAYDPRIIAPAVDGWAVSRIALDFANITQMRQTVALLRQCMNGESFARSRIVLGVSYVSMAKNSNRFPTPYTMLELEQMRHGLFTGAPRNLRPSVNWNWMPVAVSALRPVIVAHAVLTRINDVVAEARKKFGRWRAGPAAPMAQEEIEAQEVRFDDSLLGEAAGPALDEQGAEFGALVDEVRAAGSDIFVAAIPEQSFLRNRSRHIGAYYDWLDAFARDKRVIVLRHAFDNADFRDDVHANPEGSARWSRALAPQLPPLLPRP